MSNVSSSKTVQMWAERIAQCQQSNLSAPKFCQSIGCSLTSFYQWKRKLPSGISILVPVSAVDSIGAILIQVA